MKTPRALIFCNNRFAIPAIRELVFYQYAIGVCIPAGSKELGSELALLPELKDLVITIKKTELERMLKELVNTTGVNLGLVFSFPYIFSPAVLELLPLGFFNFHFGPLPKYRGPEPLFAQIRNGETQTSVCVHRVTAIPDAGPICLEERIQVHDWDTYGTLQSRLASMNAALAVQLVKTLGFTNDLPCIPQDENQAGWCPRPGFEDVFIHWEKMDAREIQNLVRACNPWNKGAGTRIGEMIFGILEVEISSAQSPKNMTAGTIVSLNSGGLQVATRDHQLLQVNVIYCPEGYLSGQRLALFGFRQGDRFQ